MASYIQTTIHSKIAKFVSVIFRQEKTNREGLGNLKRGRVSGGLGSPNREKDREL